MINHLSAHVFYTYVHRRVPTVAPLAAHLNLQSVRLLCMVPVIM